ncbi:MAG: FAD-dependent oxidoreductase [Burkholderiales bacterium]|nr:MAG: FAD-dependent oxidoreductase [Burkholderiales bacterium]
MRIAIIGAGISGLGAARALAEQFEVTLFEAGEQAGGHANTVDITLDGIRHPVDTGFLVFNHRTYPRLKRLFDELGVRTAPSDMSFSVSVGPHHREWCGTNLATVFAQPSNAISPRFLRMLADILRFNREATAIARHGGADPAMTLAEFLERGRYGAAFRNDYLLPMAAAIWSCPMHATLAFPVSTFVRFCHNHGLLQISNRPQWYTVRGGAREYVDRIVSDLDDVRLATPVRSVSRHALSGRGQVAVLTRSGTEWFDHVVFACHSDQVMRLLADPSAGERSTVGRIAYESNRAVLHTDTRLMPLRRRAWAAWNYLSDGNPAAPKVSVTYWLNRLQPLPFRSAAMVSLNPLFEPRPEHVIAEFDYMHPLLDLAAGDAQQRLPAVQGRLNTWFAGAWTGHGFHEDGLKSGLAVAEALSAAVAREGTAQHGGASAAASARAATVHRAVEYREAA